MESSGLYTGNAREEEPLQFTCENEECEGRTSDGACGVDEVLQQTPASNAHKLTVRVSHQRGILHFHPRRISDNSVEVGKQKNGRFETHTEYVFGYRSR